MEKIKGQKEYEKFERGEFLTRKQTMLALCYSCNGFEDSRFDCQSKNCPMYQYMPYKGIKMSEVQNNGDLPVLAKKVS